MLPLFLTTIKSTINIKNRYKVLRLDEGILYTSLVNTTITNKHHIVIFAYIMSSTFLFLTVYNLYISVRSGDLFTSLKQNDHYT
jgi:hypothetical protein